MTSITCHEPKITKVDPLTYEQTAVEENLILLINNYRVENNLSLVIPVEHISALAYGHNLWMVNNQVNHSFFQSRADSIQEVLHFQRVGEILAYNYSSNSSALKAWIASPSHKKVIDNNSFGYVGVSITQDTITNKKYYTVIFAGN
jgi:uncharacterized protein YkwD